MATATGCGRWVQWRRQREALSGYLPSAQIGQTGHVGVMVVWYTCRQPLARHRRSSDSDGRRWLLRSYPWGMRRARLGLPGALLSLAITVSGTWSFLRPCPLRPADGVSVMDDAVERRGAVRARHRWGSKERLRELHRRQWEQGLAALPALIYLPSLCGLCDGGHAVLARASGTVAVQSCGSEGGYSPWATALLWWSGRRVTQRKTDLGPGGR